MVPSLPQLSCESSVSVKENPDRKKGPCVTFSRIKEKVFDLSTLVYICLHSSNDSSTFV